MNGQIDTTGVDSPGWWFLRLLKKLGPQRQRCDLLDNYYCGTANVPITATKACREAYQRLMSLAKTNYAELIVESVRERMDPVGFRTGADDDEMGDKAAWRIWQANNLDADSLLIFRAMLSMADAYVIVGAVDPDIGAPLITPEDPREVITEADPRNRRKVRAALKVFTDDVEGADVAYLYLPGWVYKATKPRSPNASGEYASDISYSGVAGWEWQDKGNKLPVSRPIVPVTRFGNRLDLFGRSKGEFEPHLPLLNRIGYGVLNRLEIVTLQAFRQRAIKGDLPDIDPSTGVPIDYDDLFAADPGALWRLPATAEMWESGQVDLGAIHTVGRDDVLDLAAVSGTPLFYLTPDAANGSAEGASLARERLVFKTGDRLRQTSDPLEAVLSHAFLFMGDEQRANRRDMEVLWAPPERFSLAERYDAASKAGAAGVPWRAVMRDVLQFSPQQVDRMEAERATDAFLAPAPVPAQVAP